MAEPASPGFNTTRWVPNPNNGQFWCYDYAADEIVNSDLSRYRRPPELSIQSLENAAALNPSASYSAISPRQLPTTFPSQYSSPYLQHANNVNYTIRPSEQLRQPTVEPSSHHDHLPTQSTLSSPSLLNSRFQKLSYDERRDPHPIIVTSDPPRSGGLGFSSGVQYNGNTTTPDTTAARAQRRPDDLLYKDFKKCKQPRNFFKVGKVFHTLWSETGDDASVITGAKAWTQNSYGEWVHSKVRRFVVVKEGKLSCTALPITTYNSQGVAKAGVKKSDHAIIFTGKLAPSSTTAEQPDAAIREVGMQPYAIRIDPDARDDKLDPLSRVDFAKPCPVHHNVKVKSYGMVNREYLRHLVTQFRNVVLEDPTKGLQQRSLYTISQGRPTSTSPAPLAQYHRACSALIKDGWSQEETIMFLRPVKALYGRVAENHSHHAPGPSTNSNSSDVGGDAEDSNEGTDGTDEDHNGVSNGHGV